MGSKRRSELLATGCRNAWQTSLRENLYGCTVSGGYFMTANRQVFRSKEAVVGCGPSGEPFHAGNCDVWGEGLAALGELASLGQW